ncbi:MULTISPECIES: BON domain-containing protein [unclassified Marinobacterium]|jgi:osmotically-inducible protein OsmY|uniref:BON domain-containing protein n=1 Tax=unclassified Marinobacterium TaxID=2644139 RepID=UPI001568FD2F|nr:MULTISPECIES: BON domain-containing protein [unclassified Marinobacterium]NRP15607.1 Osmotically-inducible protein Y precursor [Marinobacterium sp. xm-a-152]NRP27699.1 Osmotically-inducible protein Y precursor [Marinobacterium sp. xm-d-420]NRP38279.1 Osmotically-inducible protein Y precursor [Marinobacterium sp. xm-a-121]NRP47062.1 Osmotically-inducible protein Y precursor [Marinobacterium sp. xm-d-543]NRP59730.1 Osmotically-inducible protein Y precursor [Marinobacterium sp. xm-d-564]
MKKVLATLVMTTTLVTGCSTIVSSSREEPIREDIGNRTLGNIIEDEAIELKVMVNLSKGSAPLAQSHINVKSFNGQVLLTGQVPNENVRQEAEQIVGQTREVKRIHNELEIAGPSSTIVRSNDIYLTSRVKLKLLSDKSIEGLRVKVVTENGIVYLMGLVSQREADQAVAIVREVPGVQRIVKVFEYVPLP